MLLKNWSLLQPSSYIKGNPEEVEMLRKPLKSRGAMRQQNSFDEDLHTSSK